MSIGSKKTSFRVRKVKAYQRGKVWYLCYFENGLRRRPRVDADRDVAKQMAAQINAQLEIGAPALLSFENISIPALRERWLQQHEQVLRSSVQTIRRYRAATEHLLTFVGTVKPVRHASQFRVTQAEEFTAHLRSLKVSPNGHANSDRRPLYDKGVKFILETCRAMFTYAGKRRHLSPYAGNPFSEMGVERIPIEIQRSKALLPPQQESDFLSAYDTWQLPVFLTLMLTGLRPGELTHLMFADFDPLKLTLNIRNRPELGWQVKTRNEREIPIHQELCDILRRMKANSSGTLFSRRKFVNKFASPLPGLSGTALLTELNRRIAQQETTSSIASNRTSRQKMCQTIWRDCGAIQTDDIRLNFMRITKKLDLLSSRSPNCCVTCLPQVCRTRTWTL